MIERVTITIKKDLLRRIDKMIDKREIRNRSHAIESLIAKSLEKSGIDTALIMSGEGGPVRSVPKPMIKINGQPILGHQIEMLRSYGITKIILAHDQQLDQVKSYFGNGSAYGVKIIYIKEEKPLGTAGALAIAGAYIDGTFAMLNVDTLMDPDINNMYDFHVRHKKLATVMLTTTADPSHFGVVKMRGNQIIRFEEKPRSDTETSRLINAGFCIFERKICDIIPKRKIMIEELFNLLCKQSQLNGFIHDGQVFDVGTKEGYDKATTIRNL